MKNMLVSNQILPIFIHLYKIQLCKKQTSAALWQKTFPSIYRCKGYIYLAFVKGAPRQGSRPYAQLITASGAARGHFMKHITGPGLVGYRTS